MKGKAMIVYTELATVERELGISARTLYALSNNIDSHYRTAHVPRRAGDVRNLSVPDKLLKTVQRRIAQRLLAYEEVSKYAKAYKIASGVVPNARPHVGAPMVLKLDIRHFFDSILYSHIKERAFPSNKYSENIRVLLSLLCYYKDCLLM